MKRVVVISDLHCGHLIGLTHPDFNPQYQPGTAHAKMSALRSQLWAYYAAKVAELQPIDILIVNGDCIDGKGERSGGTELLTSDRNEQVDMAAAGIEECKAMAVYISYGTPYHGGKDEDFEDKVAQAVNAVKIGSHDYLDVNGLVFDYRHHISSSSVPHGRHTAAARARLWNVLWSEFGEYPKSNVIIRSHVHYYDFCGGHGWLALTTPALQGCGSKFGARVSEGTVDFGLVHFDVESKGEWIWKAHILKQRQAAELMKA